MTKLAVHSVGARVVELLFGTFPAKAVAPLKLELYGPQYALFASTNSTNKDNSPSLPALTEFVENNPDKREPTLSHLQNLLQKGLDKSLTGFGYFHTLLLDYASIASPEDIRSFLAPALAEHSLHLLSTRAGTKVVCECAAYATVKDRKKMLKCLKGYTRSSLKHRDAYLAILRMCDVMDDTVLVNKMLLAELHQNPDNKNDDDDDENGTSPILDLVLSDTGSKLFLLLMVSKEEMSSSSDDDKATPRWHKYLDPYDVSVLHQNPTVTENGVAAPTSKKEDDTRRRELLVYLKELLVDVCIKHTEELMRNKSGSKVLIEVCENFATEELFQAIVEVCAANGGEDDKSLPLLEDAVGHLTMKHLFLSESKKSSDDDDLSLARLFYSRFETELGNIASSNRGAFVLSSLLQTSVKDEVKKTLKSHKKEISKLAKDGKDGKKLAGCKVLLDALK